MTQTADVIVVGAGVQGASLAFHLARRGVSVLILERSTVAAGATGRSSGFVRMHYDLESDSRLAWASYPYFRDWAERVGDGDCGFVRTGFVQLVPEAQADALRANVEMQQRVGIPTSVIDAARLPAWSRGSGPTMSRPRRTSPNRATRTRPAPPPASSPRPVAWGRATSAAVGSPASSSMVSGLPAWRSDRGRFSAPVVVDVAGAWAPALARTAGVELPGRAVATRDGLLRAAARPGVGVPGRDRPRRRHLLPARGSRADAGRARDGQRDRRLAGPSGDAAPPVDRRCDGRRRSAPGCRGWSRARYRTAHGGQDGITPDQRPIMGRAGPDGFYSRCGFSGTGFKTAPAVGACMAELILDGHASTVDIGPYALDRFAEGRRLEGEQPIRPALAVAAALPPGRTSGPSGRYPGGRCPADFVAFRTDRPVGSRAVSRRPCTGRSPSRGARAA